MDLSLEKTLPHNLEAERAVLGAILLDDKAIHTAAATLRMEDFYLESHRRIFEKMLALTTEGTAIDLVILKNELQRADELERAGGPAYVAELTNGMPRAVNVEHYARIVKQKATLRRLIQIANETQARCYQAEDLPGQILGDLTSKLFEIAGQEMKNGFEPVSELASAAYKDIEEAANKKSVITGLATGFNWLDRMTGGLHPQDLVVVAGRPGLGKTALCLNVACNAAIRMSAVVGVFSLEMSKKALLRRIIAAEARVDAQKIRAGFLNREDWRCVSHATAAISQAPIFIDDSANLTTVQLRAKAQRLALEHGLDLLVVDYMQLLSGSGRRYETRTQEVTEVSRSLKNLAKELDIPVIAVSQLNREVEKRSAARRPQLSDLRESGAIEQDADLVLFISREEVRTPTEDNQGFSDITIAKQRNGSTGSFQLAFMKQYTKFENLVQEREFDYGPIQEN
jgi:replicative DNA helicase